MSDEKLKVQDAIVNGLIEHYKAVIVGLKKENEQLRTKNEQLKSVAIPNKVGHWEYNQYDGNPNIGNWHCSECRNIVSDMPTCMGKPLYEFCPNCGCPMEIER